MTFEIGSLVRARGREWVVLPESDQDLLVLRPLGGTEEEVTGIYTPLEQVEPAHFDLPDPTQVGDYRSCRLLRDAVRLSSRAGAGPFRSFARIAVEPRPYQIVPLLMALRLDPVRLLIADDVGIGKTIEACLVAREFLDRGEVRRLAVLCPPHLAEQWQNELHSKFNIEAELVIPSTAGRLERNCRVGQSLFEIYPHVVVSMDFIKSDRRRDEFVRSAPEMVLVDEAHSCSFGFAGRSGRHQRHQLVKQLAAKPDQHLILVTAIPHSGKDEAFRSLLSFLNSDFINLPDELTGPENEPHRRRVATHFIQRRRADIRHFLKTETPFPEREETEQTYKLSPNYGRLFDRVLGYAREIVTDASGGRNRQRIRWWSALALLRSLASSPAAAASTLRERAPSADAETPEEADEIGRRRVLDVDSEDIVEGVDVAPGGDPGEGDEAAGKNRRRLLEMAKDAEQLKGDKDAKLVKAVELVKGLLKDSYSPILFCRFIPTADYLAEELRRRLPKDVRVESITGILPPAERESRIKELTKSSKYVLVCTDCLSEGINLQESFDAVMHYDLSWNPTRHEQREGRVDRYGQGRPTVRVLTYYGLDNRIDGIVLDVLIKKHKRIRSSLGISVPVPTNSDAVVEAIFEGYLLREKGGVGQSLLPGLDEFLKPKKESLYLDWDNATEKERRSRTMFAQESIAGRANELVARELEESRSAIGSSADVAAFISEALHAHGAHITEKNGLFEADLRELPRALRDALGNVDTITGKFELPVPKGATYLSRTHPFIDGLAAHVMDTALDPVTDGLARRAGAIRTRAVERRTTLLLVRFRFDIISRTGKEEQSQLAEECGLIGFAGSPESAEWLDEKTASTLLAAEPDANIHPEQAAGFVRRVTDSFEALRSHLDEEAQQRANSLLDAHRRVREAAHIRGISYQVEPKLPVDLLGVYLCLPAAE